MFGIIPGVLLLAIIVIVIVFATRRSKNALRSVDRAEGTTITRQIWLYLIALISLGIFAGGVGQLLTLLFDVTIRSSLTQVGVEYYSREQFSLGLAMTVIGGPLWFFFWRAIQRRVKGNSEEIGSVIRKLFLNLILFETAINGLIAASNFLRWLIAGVPLEEFSSDVLSMIIVVGVIWFYHWWVSEGEGYPAPGSKTVRRWYVYGIASFSLVWLVVGFVLLINTAVVNVPVWENTLVRGQFWGEVAQMSIAMVLLGGISWYFHWFRMARGDLDSTLRKVYFYLFAVSGGAITSLTVSTILLFRFLAWVLNGNYFSNGPRFQFLGWAIPTILVGTGIWGYHRWLAQEEAGKVEEKRQSAERVSNYLMTFLGLGTLVTGLSLLFGIMVDLIIYAGGTSLVATTGWWRNQLALCLALLIVGAPLWFYYWNGILRRARTGGISEWRALSRRIFLYIVIGSSILILTADLVNIIYQLLSNMLQGDFGINVLRNSKWSLQTLIVAVPLLWYHWQVLRADQRRGTELRMIKRTITLLTDDPSGDLAFRIENKIGSRIQVLYQAGQPLVQSLIPDEEIDRVSEEIKSAPSDKVMLLVLEGKMTVLPYREK